jgi:hypothetical protein
VVEAAPTELQGGSTPAAAPEMALEGGRSRKRKKNGEYRKTRKDRGKSRGSYKHHSGNPGKRFAQRLERLMDTPGGEAVYFEKGSKKCPRRHRYSKRYGTCIKHHSRRHRRSLRSYHKHRMESGPLRSSRSRSRSRSKSGRRRSGRKTRPVERLGEYA